MKPYSDIEAGKQFLLYGTVFTMIRRDKNGNVELFLLDRDEVNPRELQNEQVIR